MKQGNIRVVPLKKQGHLINDSKEKAEILLKQFASVFIEGTAPPMPSTNTKIEDCQSHNHQN